MASRTVAGRTEVRNCLLKSEDPEHYHDGTCDCFVRQLNGTAPKRLTSTAAGLKSSLVTVTPRMAATWMDANTRNRSLRKHRIVSYAQAMQRGEWEPAGDAMIVFDHEGNLLNGQHRLAAVVLAGVPQVFVVLRGVKPKAQDVMDRGLGRSLPDALGLHGEHYVNNLAAALRWLHRLDYIESMEGSVAHYGSEEHKPTIPIMLDYLAEHPDIRESVKLMQGLTRTTLHLRASAQAVHYRCSRLSHDDTEDFFEKLVTGAGMKATDPVLLFRNIILNDRANKHDARMPEYRECAMLVKTWNYYREGDQPSQLTWKWGARYREAFPLPR